MTSSPDDQHPGPDDQRIAKLLARAGIASRREVERMIAEGRVAIDGQVIDTPATILASLAGVTVDGNPVAAATPARLFLYHKPVGLLVTERDPAGRPTIYDRLPRDLPRLVPVGRLDLSTEGLLLLTTDGGLKRQLELPATGVERAYRARAYGTVTQGQLEDLIDGVEIEGVRYGSINANLERRTGANVWIEMTLTEGKNREVRRVLEHLGLRVSRLIRTRYGPFVLGDLPVGEVGEVRDGDVAAFRKNPRALPPARTTASREERPASFERRPRPERTAAPARARPTATEPDRPSTRPARSAPAGAKRTPRSSAFKATHPSPEAEAARPQRRGRPSPAWSPRDGERPAREGPGERGQRGASRSTNSRPPRGTDTDRPESRGFRPDARAGDRPSADSRSSRGGGDRNTREAPRTDARPARTPSAGRRPERDDHRPSAGAPANKRGPAPSTKRTDRGDALDTRRPRPERPPERRPDTPPGKRPPRGDGPPPRPTGPGRYRPAGTPRGKR